MNSEKPATESPMSAPSHRWNGHPKRRMRFGQAVQRDVVDQGGKREHRDDGVADDEAGLTEATHQALPHRTHRQPDMRAAKQKPQQGRHQSFFHGLALAYHRAAEDLRVVIRDAGRFEHAALS